MKPAAEYRIASDGPRYGGFGGAYIPETLVPAVRELEAAYDEARADESFTAHLRRLLTEYAGRPTPLFKDVYGATRPVRSWDVLGDRGFLLNRADDEKELRDQRIGLHADRLRIVQGWASQLE